MSSIVVTKVGYDGVATQEWERYISAHPESTIYHHLAWRTIFEKSFGYRSWMLMARDMNDSGRVVGVLPLYQIRTPFSTRLTSVPFRDRGGPLWSSNAALGAMLAVARSLLKESGANVMILKSHLHWPAEQIKQYGLYENLHWVHSSVPLLGLTKETLWKEVGPKTRNMIRQAESNGLILEDMTNTSSAVDEWLRLHLSTQKRLGIPPFPRLFFTLMLQELKKIGAIRLYCVMRGDEPMAATIILRDKKTAIYGYSASTEEAQKLRANDFMLYRIMLELMHEGVEIFDMGSDSPKQDSLLSYKRKWGAIQHPIPYYTFGNQDMDCCDSSSSRYVLARKVFSKLPMCVSDLFGQYVTRYFG